MAQLGPLIRSLSSALRTVVGCEKTYVMQFSEAEGFSHVHFHVVPRMAGFTDEQRGTDVFWFLKRPEDERVCEREMDRLAIEIRKALDR